MGSVSLHEWQTARATDLDRIAAAHRAVGGKRRGRRWATQQVDQAYTVLLSAHFQGFCRDLHAECVDRLVRCIEPATFRPALRVEFGFARRLDRGNPNPGNIGADFNRLGLFFWDEVCGADVRNALRQRKLEELSGWRNAIAHQDLERWTLHPPSLTLRVIQGWRRSCNALARSLDLVMSRYIASVTGVEPWQETPR